MHAVCKLSIATAIDIIHGTGLETNHVRQHCRVQPAFASQLNCSFMMFCTIRVFILYAYGTYHTRIPIPYDHTRMVRLIVPYKYGVYS